MFKLLFLNSMFDACLYSEINFINKINFFTIIIFKPGYEIFNFFFTLSLLYCHKSQRKKTKYIIETEEI